MEHEPSRQEIMQERYHEERREMIQESSAYDQYIACNVCYACGDDLAGPAKKDSLCWDCAKEERYRREMYCRHGEKVGGYGEENMCHWCELGMDPPPPSNMVWKFIYVPTIGPDMGRPTVGNLSASDARLMKDAFDQAGLRSWLVVEKGGE